MHVEAVTDRQAVAPDVPHGCALDRGHGRWKAPRDRTLPVPVHWALPCCDGMRQSPGRITSCCSSVAS
jgi:hypothetical protein